MDSCQWVHAFYPRNSLPFPRVNSDNSILINSDISNELLGTYDNRYGGAAAGLCGISEANQPRARGVPSYIFGQFFTIFGQLFTIFEQLFTIFGLGQCWLLLSVIRTPQYLLLSSICYHVLVYINIT